MSRLIDLTGQTFGRLTVLSRAEDFISPSGSRTTQWLCECSCEKGKTKVINGSSLKRGLTQSCGCLQKEKTSESKLIDMTGWVMKEHGVPDSRLTVIRRSERQTGKDAIWLCECECGNTTVVSGGHLKDGHTKSCGCLSKEITHNTFKKYNCYDVSGKFGIGWTSNTDREFYFDLEDYDVIKEYCWMESIGVNTGFHRLVTHKDNKIVSMHQLLGFARYDHINRSEFDNRKENLRQCTHQENIRNSSLSKNNTSGFTGVYWDKRSEKWFASIMIDGKNKYLGCSTDKNKVIYLRLQAEAKYFKEFSPQRHLFEKYGIQLTQQND